MAKKLKKAAKLPSQEFITTDDDVKWVLSEMIRIAGERLDMDDEIIPVLEKERRFKRFKTPSGAINRAVLINFITQAGSGLTVDFDGQKTLVGIVYENHVTGRTPPARKKPRHK